MFLVRLNPTATMAQSHILAQIVLGVNALCLLPGALAQDAAKPTTPPAATAPPPPTTPEQESRAITYTVRIDAPRALRGLLEDNLDLMRWRGNPRIDIEQLQRLVRTTPDEAKTLIATEGYYSPTVSAGLDKDGAQPVVRVIVDPGPATTVSDVDIELRGFAAPEKGGDTNVPVFDTAALRNGWTLPVGAQFRTADWEAAKRAMLRQVTQARFPRAQLVDSSATVDPDKHGAALKVVIDSGPDMQFGRLEIQGLQRYPASIVTNLNTIRPGDEYSQAALQALQGKLQDTGYFSSVEVSADMSAVIDEKVGDLNQQQAAAGPAPAPTAGNGPTALPVLVRVTENKRKNVSVGLGYSTNTGARAQAEYDNLNVFGKRMKSNLIYEQKHQQASADFFLPTTTGGYNNSFGASYERLDTNGLLTRTTSIHAQRAWGSPLLERTLRLDALTEQTTIENFPTHRVKSVPLTFSITKRHVDSLIQPNRGYIANVQLGAAVLPVWTDERFLRFYTRAVDFIPLGQKGTVIVRGEFGAVASRDTDRVPESFLFRAGGDQSVRGYGFQELGIHKGSAITGGRYLLTASAEYDYWFKPPWGAAVFYDVGNAADSPHDLKPKVGYGVGARWRSPVGPINVDLAYGKAVHKVRLHFSLGFTF